MRTKSSSHCTRTKRPIQPGGQAVVGGFDFDTTVQMHDQLGVLVVAERLLRQWEQGRFFLGKHSGDLRLKDPPREIDGFVRNELKLRSLCARGG